MRLGIRSISYVGIDNVKDFSMLPPGTTFELNSFLTANMKKLPFVPESAQLDEKWTYDDNGRYSDVSFSAPIRANKDEYRSILQFLTGKRCIFQIELNSGKKYVIGSKQFIPTFTFTDTVSGNSSSGFIIKIACKSLHGVLFAQ